MSDASYVDFPLNVDSTELTQQAFDSLQQLIPGWKPSEGHLEVALIEIMSRMEAETREVATKVPDLIFTYFGRSLLNLPTVDAGFASVVSKWTMVDDSGYTIPSGTIVSYPTTGDTSAFFRVSTDYEVPPGSDWISNVELVAMESGAVLNGLAPAGLRVVDALVYVDKAETTTVTSGGVDPETDDAYRDRLAGELALLSPRPILANDFAVLARRIAGVGRSIALDGYNPSSNSYNNERTVTVVVADSLGNSLSSTTKNAVQSYLDGLREINFVVYVTDPTYTTLDVVVTVKRLPSTDAATIRNAAETKLRDYLSPANWDWRQIVRYNELVSLIDQIPGVDYVDTLTSPGGNVSLAGAGSLVRAGAITINIID